MTVYVMYGCLCEKRGERSETYDQFVMCDVIEVFNSGEKAIKYAENDMNAKRVDTYWDDSEPVYVRDLDDNMRAVYWIKEKEVVE